MKNIITNYVFFFLGENPILSLRNLYSLVLYNLHISFMKDESVLYFDLNLMSFPKFIFNHKIFKIHLLFDLNSKVTYNTTSNVWNSNWVYEQHSSLTFRRLQNRVQSAASDKCRTISYLVPKHVEIVEKNKKYDV